MTTLEVNSTIKDNAIFSKRYFVLKGSEIFNRIEFPISEKYRDLLHLIMTIHFIETQNTKITDIKLDTFYTDEFLKIKKDMEILIGILTNRDINIIIENKKQTGTQRTLDTTHETGGSILFSGGVDSICGSLKLLDEKSNYLIHVPSSKTVFGKVRKTLSNPFYNNITTYCINPRIKSDRDRTAISDTRGLLFLTAGYVMSKSLNRNVEYFCENGGQLLDVMLGNEVYVHSRATKNTNLRYLKLIEGFLNKFEPGINIEYPFKNKTKAEIISQYMSDKLFESSWSCYNLRQSTQCGACWNCFITKMSAIASEISVNENMFKNDPLRHTIDSAVFKSNQNIIYDLLVFYESIINEKKDSKDVLRYYSEFFEDPIELATNFGLDIYLGVRKNLEYKGQLNGLGKKSLELLEKIDKSKLSDRQESLLKIKENNEHN